MSEEYQRLQDEATVVDCEIQEIQESCRVSSAAELAALERRLDFLTVKRASLTKAMVLLTTVEDAAFTEKQREFVGRLPHRYHSQGTRQKIVNFSCGRPRDAEYSLFPPPKRSRQSRCEARPWALPGVDALGNREGAYAACSTADGEGCRTARLVRGSIGDAR